MNTYFSLNFKHTNTLSKAHMSKNRKTSGTWIMEMANSTFDQVYAHVATGFSDTSAFLRELTLKSMLVLAPKVCAFFIIGPVFSIQIGGNFSTFGIISINGSELNVWIT